MRLKSKMAVSAVLFFSIVTLSMMTLGVQAKATKIRWEFQTKFGELIDPGYSWVSDGILHVRDEIVTGVGVEGEGADMLGTLTLVANSNRNINTGNGRGFGTWTFEVTGGDLGFTGVVSGRYTSIFVGDFAVSFTYIGFGTEGELVGWKMDGCANWNFDEYVWEHKGILLNPYE